MPAKSNIGTSAVALVASSTPAGRGVQLKASASNSGTVYVGFADTVTANSADSTDGMPLAAGESYYIPPAKISGDAVNVWLIGSASGQKIFFDAYN